MSTDIRIAFGQIAAGTVRPKSFRESAADMLADVSARGFGLAMFHTAEALRLAAVRPL